MIGNVCLLGSSSGRNSGDAALIDGIARAIDSEVGRTLEYAVPTIKPSYIEQNYGPHVKAVPMLPWNLSVKMLGLPTWRAVRRADWALVFDAILFDRSLYNPLFNFMYTLHLMLPRLQRKGTRMGFYNVGVGPIRTARGAEILRGLADRMDFIAVRDEDSLGVLESVGARNPRTFVGADAALNAPSAPASRIGAILRELELPPGEPILAINVNTYLDSWARSDGGSMTREAFLSTYSAAMKQVMDELRVPVLFVSTQHQDSGFTKQLMDRCPDTVPKRLLCNRSYDHLEVKGVLGRVELLFAMRLHAIILASSLGTPVLGLAYQPKVRHYLSTLELADRCMEFENFTVEGIASHVLRGWAERREIRDELERRIPIEQAKALRAARLIAAVDRGQRLDAAFERLADDASGRAAPRASA